MEISAKELRENPGKVIENATKGMETIITFRGKRVARMIPYRDEAAEDPGRDEIFGLWKNRDDIPSVDEHVRSIRKGRKF